MLNKEGVALAADSAVTMSIGNARKVFPSANKVFALSKHHPVGIMIYDNALFMEIPWEIIIKLYRKELGERGFAKLEDYAQNFIDFIKNSESLFPEELQERYFLNSIRQYFIWVVGRVKEQIRIVFKEKGEVTGEEIEEIVSKLVLEEHELWKAAEENKRIPEGQASELIKKYKKGIQLAIKEVFEELPLGGQESEKLEDIAGWTFVKFPSHVRKGGVSGLVFAGYGEEDVFPAMQVFEVDCVLDGQLRCRETTHDRITLENQSTIGHFAQKEVVFTFLRGIDPLYQQNIDILLSEIIEKYPSAIIDHIEDLSEEKKEEIKEKLKGTSEKTIEHARRNLQEYSQINHVSPILEVVKGLAKDQIAEMAETLVNLTSFKRKVSTELETVAGPVDVAVISKGDGFVWIKRKHYFNPELNTQFFNTYYSR